MFGEFLFMMILFNLALVYFVAQHAEKSGYDWAMWGFAVFLFGIFGLALYLFYISQVPQRPSANQSHKRTEPSLRVKCDVIKDTGEEKTVSMVIRSNDMVEAKEIFRGSCASEGLVLKEEPSVTVESNS